MITWWRALWIAAVYGTFVYIGATEHEGPARALLGGAFWTALVERMTTGAISSAR